MWEQIKVICPNACPSHLIVDFELAAMNFFSINQQDPSFALQVRLILSLTFATPTDVPDLFSELFATLITDADLTCKYFLAK